MKESSLWIVGGLLLGAGVGVARLLGADNCEASIRPGARVLLLGDSLAVGLTPYVSKICARNGSDFISLAESGTRIIQWASEPRRSKVTAALQSYRPSLVLISLGTNDSKGNSTEPELAAHADALLSMLREAKVVWILPPKLPFPDRVSGIVKGKTATFPSASYDIPQGDRIHPTAAGYAGWAELIAASLTCVSVSTSSGKGLAGLAGLAAEASHILRPIAFPASLRACGTLSLAKPQRLASRSRRYPTARRPSPRGRNPIG